MRAYINKELKIDGRNIPYPVFDSAEYFELHDQIEDVDRFREQNMEIDMLVTQILALKQSCFLLRHTTHSCESLSDGLYQLKLRLIAELEEKYGYKFDDAWMERLAG
ncbi:hypothetical protein FMM75_22705 [Lachnospiraceae bacterium MD335]|nr:hypothetical protein [Lachnospiraceae bacterium MD335]